MGRESKNWAAKETTDFAGRSRKVTVTGTVQTLASNERVSLVKAVPQGTNPTILLLDVSITSHGMGTDVLGWADVEYQEAVSLRRYETVTVRLEGEHIEVPVELIHS